jgi:hypothetical protein
MLYYTNINRAGRERERERERIIPKIAKVGNILIHY